MYFIVKISIIGEVSRFPDCKLGIQHCNIRNSIEATSRSFSKIFSTDKKHNFASLAAAFQIFINRRCHWFILNKYANRTGIMCNTLRAMQRTATTLYSFFDFTSAASFPRVSVFVFLLPFFLFSLLSALSRLIPVLVYTAKSSVFSVPSGSFSSRLTIHAHVERTHARVFRNVYLCANCRRTLC